MRNEVLHGAGGKKQQYDDRINLANSIKKIEIDKEKVGERKNKIESRPDNLQGWPLHMNATLTRNMKRNQTTIDKRRWSVFLFVFC